VFAQYRLFKSLRIIAVDARYLSHYLILFTILCKISKAKITVGELQCLCNILNAHTELCCFKSIYAHPKFRLIKLKIGIHPYQCRIDCWQLPEILEELPELFKIIVLNYKLNWEPLLFGLQKWFVPE
jgi:hypothetical protein